MKGFSQCAALLAGLAATFGVLESALAVNINPHGIGQALVYPYYTTRDDQLSLISVQNNSDAVRAVKVRFFEAKASAEVLSLNLYLSPYDIWTGAIADNGTGATLTSSDASCTVPGLVGNVAFSNATYLDDAAGDGSLDRTREGYVVAIGMAVVTGGHAALATHVESTGLPADCAVLVNSWTGGDAPWALSGGSIDTEIVTDTGVLSGGVFILDPITGSGGAYSATAFGAFNRTENLHTGPGDARPSLADADPFSLVYWRGKALRSTWGLDENGNGQIGADAVSATITHEHIVNQWSVQVVDGLSAGTDWVNTFPTKRFYVPADGSGSSLPFTTNLGPSGACESFRQGLWDSEERTPSFQNLCNPIQVCPFADTFCWSAGALTFDNSDALSSYLGEDISIDGVAPGEIGWMQLDLNFSNAFTQITENPTLVSDLGTRYHASTYFGLPSIGFMYQETIGAEGVNYAVLAPHRGKRRIDTASEAHFGLWADRSRVGTGIDLRRAETQVATKASHLNYFVTFFGYADDNTPEWLISTGTIVANQYNSDALSRVYYDFDLGDIDSARSGNVGSMNIEFGVSANHPACADGVNRSDALDLAVLSWSIDDDAGAWCIEPLLNAPVNGVNFDGLWFVGPNDNGWGFALEVEGDNAVITLYYYDAAGNPRWSQGVATFDANHMEITMYDFVGYCRTCDTTDVVPTAQVTGSLMLDLGTPTQSADGGNTVSVDVTYQGAAGGDWLRSNVPVRLISTPQ